MLENNNHNNTRAIAIIFHAFNIEATIGSVVIKAHRYADRIIVIDGGSNDSTVEIAQLAGAEVYNYPAKNGRRGEFKNEFEIAMQKDAKIIVMMSSDEAPDIIPKIIEPIRNEGYDIVVNSKEKTNIPYSRLHVRLNKRDIEKKECIGLSTECLKNIVLRNLNGSTVKDIIYQAEKNNLKIKYIGQDDQSNFHQFKDYNIAVVVPAYNEELLIEETLKGIPDYVKRIYVIDDCSNDRTPEILKGIIDQRIVAVCHKTNKGVGAAIVTGYKLALEDGMDIVAVMAGDNQMDPDQLPRLIIPIIEGRADYTKGNRLISKDFRKGMSKWRFLGNAMLTIITKIGSGYWHIMDPQNGYTAISRQALEVLNLDDIFPYYGYCNDMLIKLNAFGVRVEDVVMPARYGCEKSKIKYISYIMKVAPMNFRGFLWRLKIKYVVLDFHPLVFFYIAGIVLVPSGVIFGFWISMQKWHQIPVSQNFPLLSAFITLMGIQFLLFAMLFDMQADKSRSGNIGILK
ncbi:MAG: glycosyltransferase [Candidatus Methanoperedens sp.]|nr:glycosyltransferase [Candidatus Methanoperedens sp.]